MEKPLDLRECLQCLRDSLATMQTLALYANEAESDRLHDTCARMISHIHILEASIP